MKLQPYRGRALLNFAYFPISASGTASIVPTRFYKTARHDLLY